jgi:hypothetical protein
VKGCSRCERGSSSNREGGETYIDRKFILDMSDEEPSTSGTEREEAPRNTLFFAHEVRRGELITRFETLGDVLIMELKLNIRCYCFCDVQPCRWIFCPVLLGLSTCV